jgi:hypothetical protein
MKKFCLFLLILTFLSTNLYATERYIQKQIMKKAKIGSLISHIIFQFGKPDITFTEKSSRGAITSHRYDDGNTYVMLVTSADNRIIRIYSGIIQANK